MNVSPEDLFVVRQWVQKAERDLLIAERLMADGDSRFAEDICFHAQQCVEKYLKAVLALHQIDPPKTHDIRSIVLRLPDSEASGLDRSDQIRLTRYATLSRYPGGGTPITIEEARGAIDLARRARACLRVLLPPEALEGTER